MVIVEHMIFFLVAIGFAVLSWAAFLFVNNYLSRLKKGLLQEVLGTAVCLAVIGMISLIFNFYSLSLSIGVFILLAVLFARFLLKRAVVVVRER